MNSWLGGFKSIPKQMTIGNSDWFLHTMLFCHTQHVIQKQSQQKQIHQINEIDNDEGEENEEKRMNQILKKDIGMWKKSK